MSRKPKAVPQKASDASGQAAPKRRGAWLLILALVCAASLLVYWPSFKVPFHFDDFKSIANNPYIRVTSLSPAALYSAAFQDFRQNRPLTNLSFALNYYWCELSPPGYHAVNFAVFLATAIGILALLRLLFELLGHEPGRARTAAMVVAMLWICHPLNVQAVTYIVQRHTSAAGMFTIWSLYFFHRAHLKQRGRTGWLALAGVWALAALMCKETALALPAVLLAYWLCFFEEFKPGWFYRQFRWLAALLVFYAALALVFLRPEMMSLISDGFKKLGMTPLQRALSETRVTVWYLSLVLWPLPQRLGLEHAFTVSQSCVKPLSTLPALAGLTLAATAAVMSVRKWRLFSFGVAWYLAQLAVEAMPVPLDLAVEHRLYLASLSVLCIPGWLILRLPKSRLTTAYALVIALFFGGFAHDCNRIWLSEEALWKQSVRISPAEYRPWKNLCVAQARNGKCSQAEKSCGQASGVAPWSAEAHTALGACFLQSGEPARAESEFKAALVRDPGEPFAHYNLGLVRAAASDFGAAEKHFTRALELAPREVNILSGVAEAFARMGNVASSEPIYLRVITLEPGNAAARSALAQLLANGGRCKEAAKLIISAPRPDPRLESVLRFCGGPP